MLVITLFDKLVVGLTQSSPTSYKKGEDLQKAAETLLLFILFACDQE